MKVLSMLADPSRLTSTGNIHLLYELGQANLPKKQHEYIICPPRSRKLTTHIVPSRLSTYLRSAWNRPARKLILKGLFIFAMNEEEASYLFYVNVWHGWLERNVV